jgi:hypothetical protein
MENNINPEDFNDAEKTHTAIYTNDIKTVNDFQNETNERKINILGINNKYQVKKLTGKMIYNKEREIHKNKNTTNQIFTSQNNIEIINELLIEKQPLSKNSVLFKKEIDNKINGYKHQDVIKNIFESNKFITFNDIINMLNKCNCKCHYCENNLQIFYKYVRENKQWSLDRINNDEGHNISNVVISCLECNLKKKRTSEKSFLFTKQLKIVKSNDS